MITSYKEYIKGRTAKEYIFIEICDEYNNKSNYIKKNINNWDISISKNKGNVIYLSMRIDLYSHALIPFFIEKQKINNKFDCKEYDFETIALFDFSTLKVYKNVTLKLHFDDFYEANEAFEDNAYLKIVIKELHTEFNI